MTTNATQKHLNSASTFTVLDFDTANQSPNSACAVTYLRVENGEIIDQGYTLIKPKNCKLNEAKRLAHGITEKEIAGAPPFDEVWETLTPLIENQLVITSNCAFDIEVLIAMADDFGIPLPDFRYVCSPKRMQESLLELENVGSVQFAAFFDLRFDCHNTLSASTVKALMLANTMENSHDFSFKYNSLGLNNHFNRRRVYR